MIYEQTTQNFILMRLGQNGWAVLEREDGQRFDFPVDWLPDDVIEGDVLVLRRKKGRSDCNLRLFVNQKVRQERVKEARVKVLMKLAGIVFSRNLRRKSRRRKGLQLA